MKVAALAYIRIGNQSVPADAISLRELVLKGVGTTYDSNISKYSFSDFDFSQLKSAYYTRTGKSFEDSDYESFGLVSDDGKLTYAGALLANDSPIKQSRLFCTRWNGLDKASGVIDALDDEEFSGSLVFLLQEGLRFISRNSKKMWKKTGDNRINMPDYPARSYTEGLVNGLIHRNYLELGSEVHIDMFDDRLEIYSPGGMYDGTLVQNDDIYKVPSKRRNPVIADIFDRLNYMERRGSGFKKIIDDYKRQHFYTDTMMPEFYSNKGTFILTLMNLNYEKVATKSGDKKVATKTGDKKITQKTAMHYKAILEYMSDGREYRLDEIIPVVGVKVSRAKVLMNGLVEQGKVTTIGANRDRRYKKIT